jgi:hypothetical protein
MIKWLTKRNGFWKEGSCPNRVNTPGIAWGDRIKPREPSVKTSNVSSEIRTENLPNTRMKCHCQIILTCDEYCGTESESYVTTDDPSASLSWNKAPIWGLRPDFYYCHTVAGLLMWGALSDERTGLSFTIAAGSSQRSHSRVRVLWDSRPYFTVSDLRLPYSSPPTTRRVTVEVFDPAFTQVLYYGTDHDMNFYMASCFRNSTKRFRIGMLCWILFTSLECISYTRTFRNWVRLSWGVRGVMVLQIWVRQKNFDSITELDQLFPMVRWILSLLHLMEFERGSSFQ